MINDPVLVGIRPGITASVREADLYLKGNVCYEFTRLGIYKFDL